jgi:hypothetical protein
MILLIAASQVARIISMSHCAQPTGPFFVVGFFKIESHKLFAQAGFEP